MDALFRRIAEYWAGKGRVSIPLAFMSYLRNAIVPWYHCAQPRLGRDQPLAWPSSPTRFCSPSQSSGALPSLAFYSHQT
eukprot:6208658-Pleurochrysis_carterae.AAC.1